MSNKDKGVARCKVQDASKKIKFKMKLPRPDKSGLAMTIKDKTGLVNQIPTLQKYHLEFSSHFHIGINFIFLSLIFSSPSSLEVIISK